MSTETDEFRLEVPSRRYGRYILTRRLGTGGMADVFQGEATEASGRAQKVALKLLKPGAGTEAFTGEADLMGLLDHPNLVQRLEFGEAYGRPFIAMELLMSGDVRSLQHAHQRAGCPFPRDLGVYICIQVLQGLAYFHRAVSKSGRPLGLVHGDVNPENVFFSGEGEVKVGDFGVAKSKSLSLGPGDDVVAGKLRYLSPEQIRAEALTPASDLFAVGVMLYELICGRHPFAEAGTDERVIMERIRFGRFEVPSELSALSPIFRRALDPSAQARYRTAGAFGADLFRYALDQGRTLSQEQVRDYLRQMRELHRG